MNGPPVGLCHNGCLSCVNVLVNSWSRLRRLGSHSHDGLCSDRHALQYENKTSRHWVLPSPADVTAAKTAAAAAEALVAAEGSAWLLVKAMSVAERVGTRFYSLRQVCNS